MYRNYLRASRGIGSLPTMPEKKDSIGANVRNQVTSRTELALSKDSAQHLSMPELRQRDMMSFAYQVAKGMKYLSDLKVL